MQSVVLFVVLFRLFISSCGKDMKVEDLKVAPRNLYSQEKKIKSRKLGCILPSGNHFYRRAARV